MMASSSSQEDSSSRTRNYGDGPPWIFTGRWSICFSYCCCCCCCCFHFGSNLLLFCDSNWSYSPPLFAILMSRIYLMKYYMLRIWSRFSCQVFCFGRGGGVIARDFILLSSTNLLPKCFQMLVKFLLLFSFGSNLLLFSDWNWSYSPPPFRNSDVSFISYETLFVENLVEVLLSRSFLVTARDFILVSSTNLLPKCLQMPMKFCCCCCFIWLQSIILVVVWLELWSCSPLPFCNSNVLYRCSEILYVENPIKVLLSGFLSQPGISYFSMQWIICWSVFQMVHPFEFQMFLHLASILLLLCGSDSEAALLCLFVIWTFACIFNQMQDAENLFEVLLSAFIFWVGHWAVVDLIPFSSMNLLSKCFQMVQSFRCFFIWLQSYYCGMSQTLKLFCLRSQEDLPSQRILISFAGLCINCI